MLTKSEAQSIAANLLACPFSGGNARDLQALAKGLANSAHHLPRVTAEDMAHLLGHAPHITVYEPRPADEVWERVYERNAYVLSSTAKELDVAVNTLRKRIDAHPTLRRAQQLTREEIAAAERACDGDLDRAALHLRVGRKALDTRKRDLDKERQSAPPTR